MKLVIVDKEKIYKKSFRKYTDVADYLDDNPQFKHKKIFLINSKFSLPKNVRFDGLVFVEGYGYV